MALIGISGKIGVGKDTVGAIIQYLTSENKKLYTFNDWLDRVTTYNSDPKTDWKIKKYAGKLKQIVALLTGCKVEDLESADFKNEPLGSGWEGGTNITAMSTYRKLLQLVGTDAMRDVIHENVWVNALFADYKPKYMVSSFPPPATQEEYITQQGYPNWIITDMRFPNEAKAIKQRGGLLIRVERPGSLSQSDHPSEIALDNYHGFDYTILNNGTIDDLVKNVETILREGGII